MIFKNFRRAYYVVIVFVILGFQQKALTQTPTELLGEQIYTNTVKKAEEARNRPVPAPPREISHIFVKGAGECRDQGSYAYAIRLFEAAIREDPKNAHAYRVYGDYLMGYRGLYEQAGTKYYRAKEIIREYPEAFDDAFKESLERSIQIWHRDGKDGLPLFVNQATDDYSIYFEPFVEFTRPSADAAEYHTSGIRQLFAERLAGLNGIPETIPGIPNRLPRRNRIARFGGSLLLRFGNEALPYLRLQGEKSDIDVNGIDAGTFKSLEGDFDALEITLGKNFLLSPGLDLNLEGIYSRRFLESTDPATDDDRIADEKSDIYTLEGNFTYYFDTNTLKLKLRNSFTDIGRTEGNAATGQNFDDTANSQTAALRLSLFGLTTDKDNPSRFRGRRSTHYEIGFTRNERHNQKTLTEEDYRPYVQMEYLGILEGHLDLVFNYNTWIKQFHTILNPSFQLLEGLYEAHQFKFTPTWVFIYNLYEDTFTKGIEFLSIGIPMQYTIGEKHGAYSRFNAGVRLDTQFVMRPGIRVVPIIEGDYAWYPELERTDWGVFLKCALSY